jgi:Ca2+-binding EF-hand superfamily protein
VQSSFRKGVGSARRDKNKGRTQGLTEEQKQEIREAFDLFDTDGSGNQSDRSIMNQIPSIDRSIDQHSMNNLIHPSIN